MKRKISVEEKARQKAIRLKSERDNKERHYKMVSLGKDHPLATSKSKIDVIRRA